ncbi:MAG: glycosyltransferase family 4 protein [Anaerolineales bacterium]
MPPLRVLLISGEYPPMEGGVADFTRILAEHMVDRGACVHVLTFSRAAPREADKDTRRIHVHPIISSWGWRPLYGGLRRLLGEHDIDVVNIQYQAAAYDMHPAVNLLPRFFPRLPFVVTFHDLLVPYLFPKAGPLRWWVNAELARASRAVIVTNEEDHARLASDERISHLVTIPIGSNVPCQLPEGYDRDGWRRHLGLPRTALVLCYFGFLNASKGGEELIEALYILREKGQDAWLLMIGGAVGASDPTNRAYLERIESMVQARDLDEYVVWTGYLPSSQVSASFESADICVLPYRDGVSFRRGSLMAALVHGMPIVSTHPRMELPDLQHGGNVWLVPPRDPRALAEAVAHLADDEERRQRLQRGAKNLGRRFDWKRIAACTLEVYQRVAFG